MAPHRARHRGRGAVGERARGLSARPRADRRRAARASCWPLRCARPSSGAPTGCARGASAPRCAFAGARDAREPGRRRRAPRLVQRGSRDAFARAHRGRVDAAESVRAAGAAGAALPARVGARVGDLARASRSRSTARCAARDRRALDLDPASPRSRCSRSALSLSAVRFLWLGIFPLLLFARAIGARERQRRAMRAVRRDVDRRGGVAAARGRFFDVRRLARDHARRVELSDYAKPYPVEKYYAHAIWLLADSGVRGHLYHDYFLGGFAGYWLAPERPLDRERDAQRSERDPRRAGARSRSGAARDPARTSRRCSTGSASTSSSGSGCPRRGCRDAGAGTGSRRRPTSRTRRAGSRSSATSRARSTCARTSATATISIASRATTPSSACRSIASAASRSTP